MKTHKLVAKPDQMIGGRGKAGLIAVNKSFEEVKVGLCGTDWDGGTAEKVAKTIENVF